MRGFKNGFVQLSVTADLHRQSSRHLCCYRDRPSAGLLGARREQENISTIEGAILGLLALLFAFTFSMALSLYEVRRDALLNEANAIATTALRARLLPTPYKTECLMLLRRYIKIRLDIARGNASPPENPAAVARSNAIQELPSRLLWRRCQATEQTWQPEAHPAFVGERDRGQCCDAKSKRCGCGEQAQQSSASDPRFLKYDSASSPPPMAATSRRLAAQIRSIVRQHLPRESPFILDYHVSLRAVILWVPAAATAAHHHNGTGLFEIQADHLRGYRQDHQLVTRALRELAFAR